MNVDYDFCRSSKLVANDLIIWLDLDQHFDDALCAWNLFNRNWMILDDNQIRISCFLEDFDRWSNSEEMCFDISKTGEKNRFIDWVIEQRKSY